MKYAWLFVVTFATFLLTSCSDIQENQSPVSSQMVSTLNKGAGYKSVSTQIPIKEWRYTATEGGIFITFGCDMQEYDFIFAVIQNQEFSKTQLVFLQKINDEYYLALSETNEISDVRVYGNKVISDIGVYPFAYLQNFEQVKVNSWSVNGPFISISNSAWNHIASSLFVEVLSEDQNLLVYVGEYWDYEFAIPNFDLKQVDGIKLFVSSQVRAQSMDKY